MQETMEVQSKQAELESVSIVIPDDKSEDEDVYGNAQYISRLMQK